MATIKPYDTASGRRYRVRYRRPDGRQTDKRGFTTKKAAELWAAENTVDLASGAWLSPEAGKTPLSAVADAWLASKNRVTPKTRAGYTTTTKIHLEPLRALPVAKVTPAVVQDWVDTLEGSPKTVRNAASILHSIMGRAVRDRLVQANPCDGIDLPKVSAGTRNYLTAAQVESLARVSKRPTLVNTLAYAGVRWGELAALHASDIDPAARRILVRRSVTEVSGTLHWGETKNRTAREVPIPTFLADQLRFAIKDKDPDELVFTAPQGGSAAVPQRTPLVGPRRGQGGRPRRAHPARTAAHLRVAGDPVGGEREGRAADARPLVRGADLGPVWASVRRRLGRGGGRA